MRLTFECFKLDPKCNATHFKPLLDDHFGTFAGGGGFTLLTNYTFPSFAVGHKVGLANMNDGSENTSIVELFQGLAAEDCEGRSFCDEDVCCKKDGKY